MPAPSLYVRQLRLGPMKNFVYLVGAPGASEVTVVDPAWDVEAIRAAAREDGKEIVSAVLSHCHHDHINGVPGLLQSADIPIHVQKEEVAFSADLREFADALRPAAPGDTIQVGPLEVTLVHTPGHTPGSQCVLTGGALISGDTVFVNACGRCDLGGGDPEQMYRSLYQVLGRLPDSTQLLPGHDYGDVPVSSLGREKQHNPYYQFTDAAAFVAYRSRPRR